MNKKLNFWAKELTIADVLCQLKVDNKNQNPWENLNHAISLTSEPLDLDAGVFPYLELAVSIVFIGEKPSQLFVNQHGLIAKKLKEIKTEVTKTLGMLPSKSLILDDLFRSWTEEQWHRFDDLSCQQPFLYTLSQTATAWEWEGKVLFLFNKRDDEQKEKHFTICLGSIESKPYHEILNLLG